jgi:ferredoxin-thioredoxin reductase catalytic subunit
VFAVRYVLNFTSFADRRGLHIRKGRTMTQTVTRRPLNAEAWARCQCSPCRILGGQTNTGTGLTARSSVFPCDYNSINVPYSSSCCCYWRTNGRILGNLPKSNAFSELG